MTIHLKKVFSYEATLLNLRDGIKIHYWDIKFFVVRFFFAFPLLRRGRVEKKIIPTYFILKNSKFIFLILSKNILKSGIPFPIMNLSIFWFPLEGNFDLKYFPHTDFDDLPKQETRKRIVVTLFTIRSILLNKISNSF